MAVMFDSHGTSDPLGVGGVRVEYFGVSGFYGLYRVLGFGGFGV